MQAHNRYSPLPLVFVSALLAASACVADPPSSDSESPKTATAADFTAAGKLLQKGVEDKAYPGCAVIVGTSGGVLWRQGFGKLAAEGDDATPQTLYDLASMTKIVGTTSVLLTLVRDEKLSVTDPVSKYLPSFLTAIDDPKDRARREKVTLEHLLTHSAGLAAGAPLYKTAKTYEGVLAAALAVPLEADPGTREKYSDLGMIILGEIVGRAGGKKLPELERERVFAPLGLKDTLRNPPKELLPRIAPTERKPDSQEFWHGIVHDENARAGEGATGHAGIFATADDLGVWAAEWLKGTKGESKLLPRELVENFSRRRELVKGSSRALGWDTPSGISSAGTKFDRTSFGHTGFTGTSVWIDPTRDLYVILLSNAVYPQRGNTRLFRIRRELCDAVVEALSATAKEKP